MWPRLSDSISIFLESWILRKSILVLYCTVLAAAVVSPAQRVSAAVCAGSAQGAGAGISPARTRISPHSPAFPCTAPPRSAESRAAEALEGRQPEQSSEGMALAFPLSPAEGTAGWRAPSPPRLPHPARVLPQPLRLPGSPLQNCCKPPFHTCLP